MSTPTLEAHFRAYFRVLSATTAERLRHAQRIRYDVYCREFGFEREEDCPGGLERDEYDEAAAHCLVMHRASDEPAGCIRVISPPPEDPGFQLPIERYCGHSLTHPELHPARMPREKIAEVSRLAVHTRFRRRAGEMESPAGLLSLGLPDPEERRAFPLLGLALFCAGSCLMSLAGREEAFVMMDRRLARRLQGSGFPFVQVGEPMEYHGLRAAYHVPVQRVLDAMPEEVRGLYRFVYESLEADLASREST